jgi:hypothetical protein
MQDYKFISEILSEGDFFLGTDKDLYSKVYPVFNTGSDWIKLSEMRVNTGAIHLD